MQGWQTTFLGMHELPRDISDFEMKTFSLSMMRSARQLAHAAVTAHKLGLALHIGFLRMSGRLLKRFGWFRLPCGAT